MTDYVIGVNPDVLRWARESSGFSLQDVAKFLRKEESKICQWESGEASPTYVQLEKLAYDLYKRPVAVFFFPEPPKEPDPKESFRTLPDFEVANLIPDTKHAIREARAMQIALRELNRGIGANENLLLRDVRVGPRDDIVTITRRVRAYLQVPLEQQTGWPGEEKALQEWRDTVQECGIFVFKRSFKQRDVSGFCLQDDDFPIIYLNNSAAKSRQIFSLFHELAHLLLRTSGVTKLNDQYVASLSGEAQDIEVFCNRFAGEFLVPAADFNSKLSDDETPEQTAERLSDHYKVSREVVLRRLLDNGVIDHRYYRAKVAEWHGSFEQGRRERRGGGDYYANQATYLGKKFLTLAFRQFHEGNITLEELASYTNVRAKNVPGLEKYVLESVSTR